MPSRRCVIFVLVVLLLSPTLNAQSPTSAAERELLVVVQGLADAQRTFDQAAMERLLADDYVEVSPVGEVDLRAKVLGFYAPELRGKSPQPSSVVLDEPNIRVYGDHAIVIVRQTIKMEVGGVARSVVMRATAELRMVGGTWRIASMQYTPIPPPRK